MAHRLAANQNQQNQAGFVQRWLNRLPFALPGFFSRGYLWLFYLFVLTLLVYYFRIPVKAYEKVDSRMPPYLA